MLLNIVLNARASLLLQSRAALPGPPKSQPSHRAAHLVCKATACRAGWVRPNSGTGRWPPHQCIACGRTQRCTPESKAGPWPSRPAQCARSLSARGVQAAALACGVPHAAPALATASCARSMARARERRALRSRIGFIMSGLGRAWSSFVYGCIPPKSHGHISPRVAEANRTMVSSKSCPGLHAGHPGYFTIRPQHA